MHRVCVWVGGDEWIGLSLATGWGESAQGMCDVPHLTHACQRRKQRLTKVRVGSVAAVAAAAQLAAGALIVLIIATAAHTAAPRGI